MDSKKNPVLSEHFEQLRELIPEVYGKSRPAARESKTEKLYNMLKNSLGIIEAVYLQNRDKLGLARIEEYGKIVGQLKKMGYSYTGNKELIEKSADSLLLQAKLPMQKATGRENKRSGNNRKAV